MHRKTNEGEIVQMDINYEKQTILIVDDSRLNLMYLSTLLLDQYNVNIAANGTEALKIIFSKNPPDLILLDVVMPEMDGYEVCKRIKSEDSTKNIPVIFITGNEREDDEIYGFKIGAVDYITKPFNPVVVNARVNTHMELIRYRNYLESISYLDGLTNISNRRRFNEHSEMLWNIAKREKKVISIIMIDIDYFKAFNDIYGHQAGDACLFQVAQSLSKTVLRKTDLTARYGGEEFVCILPNTGLEDAFSIGEKIRKEIIKLGIPHKGSKVLDIVTISLGAASCIPDKDNSLNMLIKNADDALYYSKKNGRNCTNIYINKSSLKPAALT